MPIITDYGRPMKPFLSKSQTLGLGQTIWPDNFWGILLLRVSCPCFSLIIHYFYKNLCLYIQIQNIYLGLGFEFGPQRIRDCVSVVCAYYNESGIKREKKRLYDTIWGILIIIAVGRFSLLTKLYSTTSIFKT